MSDLCRSLERLFFGEYRETAGTHWFCPGHREPQQRPFGSAEAAHVVHVAEVAMHTAVLVHPMVKRVQEEVAEILTGPCLDGQYFTGGMLWEGGFRT